MEPIDYFTHKYVAVLRCRTWAVWPEWSRCVLPAYQDPLRLADGRPIALSVYVKTYARRERPENRPAQPLDEKTAAPVVWRGRMETGYWLGTQYLKAPEDELLLQFHYEPPYEGEIDIQLHIGLTELANPKELARVASPICTSVVALLNASIGDALVPVAPLRVLAFADQGAKSESSVLVAVRRRPDVDIDTVKATILGFIGVRARMSAAEAHAISVAARRYLTSQAETDPIDKYCDLWESCEFAVLFQKAKGGKVGKVAQALTLSWNDTPNRGQIRKAEVERVLEIKRLYETRGRIVHQALDSPEGLSEHTAMLESVATELLRFRFGMPFSGEGYAFERLSTLTQ